MVDKWWMMDNPCPWSRRQGCWNPNDPDSDRRFLDERLQTPTIRYIYIYLKLCIQEFSRNASEPFMWALRSTLSFFTDGDSYFFQGPDSTSMAAIPPVVHV
jgi:hypothetical protein